MDIKETNSAPDLDTIFLVLICMRQGSVNTQALLTRRSTPTIGAEYSLLEQKIKQNCDNNSSPLHAHVAKSAITDDSIAIPLKHVQHFLSL